MYAKHKRLLLKALVYAFISTIYAQNNSNNHATLLHIVTSNVLQGEGRADVNTAPLFLNELSSANNKKLNNGALDAATSAAATSVGVTYPKARLNGLLFNGNDLTIFATTDARSTIDVTLHTPRIGTVSISLDDNPYTSHIIGLKIVQDQPDHTFTTQGDISLDYAFNIADNASVSCDQALNVLSGVGGVFIYIEDGCLLEADSITFDGKNQSAVRNYGYMRARSGDIVMQNTLGTGPWAGIENRGNVRALAGSIFMNNNQGGDTSAAIYNSSCMSAHQNISMNANIVGSNNFAIHNTGVVHAQYDIEIANNQCGTDGFALYNEASGQITVENHHIAISNNNEIVNYGTIAAPLQLTFYANAAVSSIGVLLQDSGVIQSDTIQFINNSGAAQASGVEMNGTIYSYDHIIIMTEDCGSLNQNVLIQTPFYLCNSDKQKLLPGSQVIINSMGSCELYPILSVLGDIVFDGEAQTLSITVPSSDSISDYITAIGPVSVYIPPAGEFLINGIPYADTIPGLTVLKDSPLLPFNLICSLMQKGSMVLTNHAQALFLLGLFQTASGTGDFVQIGADCLLASVYKVIFDGDYSGSFVNNGILITTNFSNLTGGDILIKNSASNVSSAVTQNGYMQTPVAYSIVFNDNVSTSHQGVLLTDVGGIQTGSLIFNHNIGADSSYGLDINSFSRINHLEITVDCSQTNQRYAINTMPSLYDNSGPLPEDDIVISNTDCPI